MPLQAQFDPILRTVDTIFDLPLKDGIIDPSNWTIRMADIRYPAIPDVIVLGTRVTWQINLAGIPDPGPDMVKYIATPPDLQGIDFAEVDPFEIAWIE